MELESGEELLYLKAQDTKNVSSGDSDGVITAWRTQSTSTTWTLPTAKQVLCDFLDQMLGYRQFGCVRESIHGKGLAVQKPAATQDDD